MDERSVAAWNDNEFIAPLVETPSARARRLSRMLYHALVERGMGEAQAELAAETLLERLEEEAR
jgi:hypothetical protein